MEKIKKQLIKQQAVVALAQRVAGIIAPSRHPRLCWSARSRSQRRRDCTGDFLCAYRDMIGMACCYKSQGWCFAGVVADFVVRRLSGVTTSWRTSDGGLLTDSIRAATMWPLATALGSHIHRCTPAVCVPSHDAIPPAAKVGQRWRNPPLRKPGAVSMALPDALGRLTPDRRARTKVRAGEPARRRRKLGAGATVAE